jgi:hypothetical protein
MSAEHGHSAGLPIYDEFKGYAEPVFEFVAIEPISLFIMAILAFFSVPKPVTSHGGGH